MASILLRHIRTAALPLLLALSSVSKAACQPQTVIESGSVESFGAAIAALDLTGDGKAELIVGAPRFTAGERHYAGRVAVYRSGLGNMEDRVQSWIGDAGSLFGASIALGDVNGDGYADLLVGAPGTNRSRGSVYLIPGGKGGGSIASGGDLSQGRPALTLAGEAELGVLGTAVAVGDLDGDGLMDIAVGAPMTSSGSLRHCGHVFVIRGSKSFKEATLTIGANSEAASFRVRGREDEALGHCILIADADGDGHADLILGSPWYRNQQGCVIVIRGGRDFFKRQSPFILDRDDPDLVLLGNRQSRLGESLAVAPFGDGGAPVLFAGEPRRDSGRMKEAGAVHAIPWPGDTRILDLGRGRQEGIATLRGQAAAERFGSRLHGVPARGETPPALLVASPDASRVVLFEISGPLASGLEPARAFMPPAAKGLGSGLAAADLEGDGKIRFILGAPVSNQVFIF